VGGGGEEVRWRAIGSGTEDVDEVLLAPGEEEAAVVGLRGQPSIQRLIDGRSIAHHVEPLVRIDGQAVGERHLGSEMGKVGMKGRKGTKCGIEVEPAIILIA
jgi:hypothetical protein